METNRLRQFCVIYETLNLRAAAELLHLSHSALSKSMQVLQAEIGIKLLQPEGRGIQITDEGKSFYLRAKTFLAEEDALLSFTEIDKNIIRVATFEIFSTYLVPGKWEKYFEEEELELRELLPGKMEAAIARGEVDFGLTYEPIPTSGVEFLKLGKLTMGIFAKANKWHKTSLNEIPFVAPVTPIDSIPSGPKGLDGWPEDKITRLVKYRVDMLESGLSLVRNGLCAIFIPAFLAKLHNERTPPPMRLEEIPQDSFKPIIRTVYLVKRKTTAENAGAKKLARMVRNECM